jgi:hypothetical protein
MRALSVIIVIVASFAFAEQPTTRRPLTTAEAATLKGSVDLGHRVLAAWSRYSQATYVSSPIPTGAALFTNTPTLELLHATHSLSDSDFALSLQCQIKLHPVPVGAPNDAPILCVRTDRGELVFDISGNITLQPPK